MKVWVDIDNPPQTRYLLPLARSFERRGAEVTITARNYGETLSILASEGASFRAVGKSFGRKSLSKAVGTLARARELSELMSAEGRPSLVLTGARSAVVAARRHRVPSFIIVDYEYVNLLVYKFSGSQVIFPDVIGADVLRDRGVRRDRLIPFRGLKEDFSFACVDIANVAPHVFAPGLDSSIPRVLVRPPAERSHYHRSESAQLNLALLKFLSATEAQVVYAPRYPHQAHDVQRVHPWKRSPLILQGVVPFVSLLKGVDVVISAGGTMLREAAFLGIPAYSTFKSRIGGVDRYLQSLGRLEIIEGPQDFDAIRLAPSRAATPLRRDEGIMREVLDRIVERARNSNPQQSF